MSGSAREQSPHSNQTAQRGSKGIYKARLVGGHPSTAYLCPLGGSHLSEMYQVAISHWDSEERHHVQPSPRSTGTSIDDEIWSELVDLGKRMLVYS